MVRCGGDSKTALGESGRRDGPRAGRGLQNFAEARAGANEVAQKADSPSF